MKVLHVIPSLARSDGGPARAVLDMVQALSQEGVAAEIATTDHDGPGKRCQYPLGEPVQREDCTVRHFPLQGEFYKVSLPLRTWLRANVGRYDAVHVHALFSFAPWAAGRACAARQVPYIVRPLGVLNPWGMEQRRPWLKSLSFKYVDRPLLERAAAIHYASTAEAGQAARLNLRTPAVTIPLGMHFPGPAPRGKDSFIALHPQAAGRPLVLFLGRIDPVKGLDLLLSAFKAVLASQPRALLVIAGKGDPVCEQQLRLQAAQLGLDDNLLWTGFLDGAAKRAALAAADVFAMPSHSENFGIALLEAMAAGCACLATPGVALAHDAGGTVRIVPSDPASIAREITDLLADPSHAAELGAIAQARAREHFSAQGSARALVNLYARVLPPQP